MRRKPSLFRRFVYAGLFFITGVIVLQAIAWWQNPPERCVERGGTWHWDGRWCEEVEPTQ